MTRTAEPLDVAELRGMARIGEPVTLEPYETRAVIALIDAAWTHLSAESMEGLRSCAGGHDLGEPCTLAAALTRFDYTPPGRRTNVRARP